MKTVEEYKQMVQMLRMKRSTFFDHWRELAENVLPRHARFLTTDRTRAGTKRNTKIINSTPTKAAQIEATGMAAAITSPVRIWFRLGTQDPDLMKIGRIQSHLYAVEQQMRAIMNGSNFYNGMGNLYFDLVVFGTAAMFIDEDDITGIRCYPLMIGSYYLESSDRLQVDTCVREVSMTVKQMITKFGFQNCSNRVQMFAKEKKLYEWIDIIHVVEPNEDYINGQLDARGKKFLSAWYEQSNEGVDDFLKISGYHEFPVIAPRWYVTAEDNYGSCPAMDALGDCRQLQKMESQKLKNYDKATDPSLVAPTSLRNQKVSLIPGDITYNDSIRENSVRPIQDPGDNARAVQIGAGEIREVEQRIKGIFSNEIWLMMERQENDGVQPDTARAVDEKHEEKMLQLGPTLSRFDDEALNPGVKRVYSVGLRANMFPPAPPELRGQVLKIQYINIMAQAQKLLETSGIERLAGFVASLSATSPEAKDLIDIDTMVRDYAEMVGVNPDIIYAEAEVLKIRQQKAQAAQQQQMAAGAQQGATTAQKLSQVPMAEDNALTRLMALYGGGAQAPGIQ